MKSAFISLEVFVHLPEMRGYVSGCVRVRVRVLCVCFFSRIRKPRCLMCFTVFSNRYSLLCAGAFEFLVSFPPFLLL